LLRSHHGAEPPQNRAETADDGVDVTLIRWMLGLSPKERLAVLQGFADSVAALRNHPPADPDLIGAVMPRSGLGPIPQPAMIEVPHAWCRARAPRHLVLE
jgi:hypothetical protein